ncbi:hypothetical protein Tco_0877508 [Tanacetum coccineum]|uniref:Uncharacterized protein n=1 Tax=Tanacetum coccineum TaxID=301880 RepID=A0ABQ5BXU2_9ASTR
MERGFLSQKGSGGKRDVKEKSGVEPFAPSVTIASGNAKMKVELPIVVDETVVKEKQCFGVNTTGWDRNPPILRSYFYAVMPLKEYRPVPKKPNANSSGNKKKGVEHTIKVSNSNPFDVLNMVDNDEDTGTTPIIDKIRKFEELLTSGQAILVDKPVYIFEEERVGFGTQSLLEQWRDSYGNGEYDDDPYDDDMYEGHDVSQELQAICDNLDIRVRGRKKK